MPENDRISCEILIYSTTVCAKVWPHTTHDKYHVITLYFGFQSSVGNEYCPVSHAYRQDRLYSRHTVVLHSFHSYHEQGFLHPPRPATFQQPGFLIGDIHFVSSANQRAPYQNNIVCKSNFIQKSFACHLQRLSHFFLTWKKCTMWVPVCFEVILSISDQTRVPLDHNAIHWPRCLHNTIWKKLDKYEKNIIEQLNY